MKALAKKQLEVISNAIPVSGYKAIFATIMLIAICVWLFAPRPSKAVPKYATFSGVKIHKVGTKYVTFAYQGDVVRLELENMPDYYQKLVWLKLEDSEVDLSILPVAKTFQIIKVENSQVSI